MTLRPTPLVWTSPGQGPADSMPLGNGDIGLNVWIEEDGDLVFYLSKTDAWDENGGLLKLGRIRITISPNPFRAGADFHQALELASGAIRVRAAAIRAHVWVDAHHPVVRVMIDSDENFHLQAKVEMWRTVKREMTEVESHSPIGRRSSDEHPVVYPDQFVTTEDDAILWCHRNQASCWTATLEHQQLEDALATGKDPLFNRTFGALMRGQGMIAVGEDILKTVEPRKSVALAIYPLTAQTETVEEWARAVADSADRCDAHPLDQTFADHRRWWEEFWRRSWIRVSGTPEADVVNRGYELQRFVTACSGRGAYPIKFNGSIFTVDGEYQGERLDADFRLWGGGYWFQNTRLIYWSMLMAGDFDFVRPWAQMYIDALPVAKLRAEKWFGIDGAAMFPETMSFWGTYVNDHYGFQRTETHPGLSENLYIRRYWQGMLELLALLLDLYAFTRDEEILHHYLLVLAPPFLRFYRGVFPLRDEDGRMRMIPAQSLETWHEAVNPTPDIAGLHWVLNGLLDLPEGAYPVEQRAEWEDFRSILPPVPIGSDHSCETEQKILPALEYNTCKNMENPELYAVFPYRLYGVDKPGLQTGVRTFEQRLVKNLGGWGQDPIDAALLGLVDDCRAEVVKLFSTPHANSRFPAFWGPNFDWVPDQDHGSVASIALQRMLLHADGGKMLLFPAWPKEWDVDFRLHAPDKTVVEGKFHHGKLLDWNVFPSSRREGVNILLPDLQEGQR